MKKPSAVITGASGLLGRMVVIECQKFMDVVGIVKSRYRNEPYIKRCDLLLPEMESLVKELNPTYIIHCAAERFPDKVEKNFETTKLLNVDVSRRLAKCSKEIGAKLIYISTDYVFDGSCPPYRHTDEPNPLNKYGQTKLEGEKSVFQENPDSCVLRIPILYGPVEYIGESAVSSLLPLLLDSTEKTVSHYEKRYPSHVHDIANIILSLVQLMDKGESIRGIFQWSGKEQLTKYEMICKMANVFGVAHSHIIPDSKPVIGAPRPYDSKMDNARLEDLGICFHTSFECGIKSSLEEWFNTLKNKTVT